MSDANALDTLAALAREAGVSWIAAETDVLAERLREGRFYVVCVGQFKRGKSTLLNALIGTPVLPTGVIPVTAAVTVIRYGDRLAARVRFRDRDWEDAEPAALATYVSEEHNPGNEKGVTGVEVFVPSELLRSGMCLVDTPGIGSVSAANTEATRAFVPHIDAAVVVLGADPPITGEELALVAQAGSIIQEIIVVFSKADRQPDAERAEAIRFTRRVLEETLRRPPGPIFQVSAAERLAGTGPPRDWDRLVARLDALARESGAALVKTAEERETRALGGALIRELDEQRRALTRPIEESEERVASLRIAVADAERSLVDLGYLLRAEQDRLARRFTEDRDRFFSAALPAAAQELRQAIRGGPASGRTLRARALELARDVTARWVDRWRREEEPRAEALYREAERRFVDLANTFRQRLALVPGLEGLPALSVHEGFRAKSQLYYTQLMHVAPSSLATWLHDVLLPWRRSCAVERAAVGYLERLLHVNSARIKNDFEQRVIESRRLLEREIWERLHGLLASAERALAAAREAHAAGTAAVRDKLEWLDRLRQRVATLEGRDAETGSSGHHEGSRFV